MLPATASSSVSCKALDSCTRKRRVRALETPLFMARNVLTHAGEMRFLSALRLADGKGLLRAAMSFVSSKAVAKELFG